MQSKASTVDEYLAELPEDRRETIEAVRAAILENLDTGFEEGMQYGMIGYYVPHSVYPAGYHCNPEEPVPYAALASQKNYVSLYLTGLYTGAAEGESETEDSRWFQEAWAAARGKKPNMGKCCVRFKKLGDVPLEVVGEMIRRVPTQSFLERYEASIPASAKRKAR